MSVGRRLATAPPDNGHLVDQGWRFKWADGLEARVVAIQNWLAHTDDLVAQAELANDQKLAAALRQIAALARERRDGLASEARELRAGGHE